MGNHLNRVLIVSAMAMAFTVTAPGCSGRSASRAPGALAGPTTPSIPSVQGPVIDTGQIPPGKTQVVRISNGAEIVVQNLGGKLYHEVEGTLSPAAYAGLASSLASMPATERDAHLGRELQKALRKLGAQGQTIAGREYPAVAYFTFLAPYTPEILGALKAVALDHAILLNPVTVDREALKLAKSLGPQSEGLGAPLSVSRDTTERFSGLARIHAPEFVKLTEAEIGGTVKVNGSTVKLGIGDTGLTLNHPTFLSAIDGHNRIEYLKDFTREGRVYFNPAAKLEVVVPPASEGASAEDLTLNAQIIVTPKLPDLPAAEQLTDVKGLNIKVSAELRQILTTPGSGAKLGALLESTLNSTEEGGDKVDINGNGKLDDKLWMVFVPGQTAEEDSIYLDATGTGDFRKSARLRDWNLSRDTVKLKAEVAGFEFKQDKLPKAGSEEKTPVRSVSIVGYDPGNHGSHVGGIAGGSRTILNDAPDTLARGVAPEARLLLNRVCSNNAGCSFTEGAVDLALNGGAEVINLSLGGLSPFNDGLSVQDAVVNRLTFTKNTLFVISAGNSGPGRQTVGSPSVARLSLSVGATATQGMIRRQYQYPGQDLSHDPKEGERAGALVSEDEDFLLFFSSRGPTAAGGFKPNVTAPGTELSSIQLNAAPGSHSGLDVYWGTSMAAPTAAGAYALFLDAARKYNLAHPAAPLATDALTLRSVFIQSARAFDVASYDSATGKKTTGRYTWADQGKGMIDLVAAWELLKRLRVEQPESAVKLADGKSVELEYSVVVQAKLVNGKSYDGTRAASAGTPALGSGIYLDTEGTTTAVSAMIARRLPENLAAGPEAGELSRQLSTTSDQFVLRTRFYGVSAGSTGDSGTEWLRVGTLEQPDCWESPRAERIYVQSTGVDVAVKPDGTAEVANPHASNLNVCINRAAIQNGKLAPGDHGALIEAYRVVGDRVSPVPSFTVPVYIAVPKVRLAGSSGYSQAGEIRSFEVARHYVAVPVGTRVVRITLEVPEKKAGEPCSGIELMALLGTNSTPPFKKRPEARIANCALDGSVEQDPAKRKLVFSTNQPQPGLWDVHVFGQYHYARSSYRLSVDYVNAEATPERIVGSGTALLTGSLTLKVLESSLSATPDSTASRFELTGIAAEMASQVAKDAHVIVPGAGGELRRYPADTVSVQITTGGSAGNDLDLSILECPGTATSAEDPGCELKAQSGGATDVEAVSFKPVAGKAYLARVDGYDVKPAAGGSAGKFVSTETVQLVPEAGLLAISGHGGGSGAQYLVSYAMPDETIAASKILKCELLAAGKHQVTGAIRIRAADGTPLATVPVLLAP